MSYTKRYLEDIVDELATELDEDWCQVNDVFMEHTSNGCSIEQAKANTREYFQKRSKIKNVWKKDSPMKEFNLRFPKACSPMTIFLDQCDGCPDLDIEVKQQTLYAGAKPYAICVQIQCRDVDKCAHLIKRIKRGDA